VKRPGVRAWGPRAVDSGGKESMDILRLFFVACMAVLLLYGETAYQKVILGTFYSQEDANKSMEKFLAEYTAEAAAGEAAYGFELLARPAGKFYIVVAEPVASYSDAKAVAEIFRPFYGDAQIARYNGDKVPRIAAVPETENTTDEAVAVPEPLPVTVTQKPVAPKPAVRPAAEPAEEQHDAPAAVPTAVSTPAADVETNTSATDSEGAAETTVTAPAEAPLGIEAQLERMDAAERDALLQRWQSAQPAPQPSEAAAPSMLWQNYLILLLLLGGAVLGGRYRMLLQRGSGERPAEVPAAPSADSPESTESIESPEAEEKPAAESKPPMPLAHEVRTALKVINTALGGLQRAKSLDASQQPFVREIKEHTALLERLLKEAGEESCAKRSWILERYDFNLNDVLEGLSRLIAHRAAEQGDEIIFMVEKEVPIQLTGDGMRLQQVLLTLMENAVDATQHGEIRLQIEHIVTVGDWTTLSFSVDDTGHGMSETTLAGLFDEDPEQGNTFKGLDMRMAKELIKMLGGTLNVQSEAGKGSRIYFTANFNLQSSMERRKYRIPDEKGFDRRLLVVDENVSAGAALQRKLSYFKLPVDTLDSWAAAQEELTRHADKYGHIFINETLLEGPGHDKIIHQLDNSYAEPVIVTYDLGKYDDRFKNPVHYLAKPYSMQRILKLLQGLAKERSAFEPQATLSEARKHFDDVVMQTPHHEEEETFYRFEMEDVSLQLEGRHVLLIDPNRANQGILKWILEQEGIETTIVSEVEEGMKLLEASRDFDLILLDVRDPNGSSEMIRSLTEDSRKDALPVIAMGTQQPENLGIWLKRNHIDGFLPKPVYKEDLFDLFKELLHNRAARLRQ